MHAEPCAWAEFFVPISNWGRGRRRFRIDDLQVSGRTHLEYKASLVDHMHLSCYRRDNVIVSKRVQLPKVAHRGAGHSIWVYLALHGI